MTSENSLSSINYDMYTGSSYNKVIDFGSFYNPAWKHYGKYVIVGCDRCGKNNINSCIGFGSQDLCLICADELTRTPKCTHYQPITHNEPVIRPFRII